MTSVKGKKFLAVILAAAVCVCMLAVPETVSAKSKSYLRFTNVSAHKTVQRGKSFKVKYNTSKKYRHYKIKWRSSDTKTASISSNGTIKAKKDGTVTITGSVKNHSSLNDKCTVTVRKSVSKVSISGIYSGYVMNSGETKKLKGKVSPTDATDTSIKWSSADESIVSVDQDGTLTANKDGETVIKAASKDAPSKYKKIKVYVGVKASAVDVTGKNIIRKGHSVTLKSRITPSDAANKAVRWSSSNKKVATVSSHGKVRGLRKGKATITAVSVDGSKKKSFTVRVATVSRNDTHFIAHRGLKSMAPENTASAFTLAGKAGFWGTECDVWETKHADDGSFDIIIQHDSTFERMCGDTSASNGLTADEVKKLDVTNGANAADYDEHVCFFSRYLRICKKYDMVPVVEIKDLNMSDEALHKVVDMLYHNGLLKKANIISFDLEKVTRARDYAVSQYNITPDTFYIIDSKNGSVSWQTERASSAGLTGVSLKRTEINDDIFKYCTEKGLKINLWPYRSSNATTYENMYNDIQHYTPDSVTTDNVMFD